MANKKYFIVDDETSAASAVFDECSFDTEEDAIKEADYQWERMTERERKECDAFFVGLYEVDEDGLPDVMIGCDVVKEYKG